MIRISFIFAALLAACTPTLYAQGGPPPATVVVDAARVEVLTQRRAVTGEIRSPMRSQLAVQVEGIVLDLLVDEGDEVDQGEIIARLDDTRARLQLNREDAQRQHAEALIVQRQAELDEAQRDFERVEELQRRGSAGVTEIDEAQTLLASRAALLAQAKAELLTAISDFELAQRELADTQIRAPFAGKIVETHTEIGQWISRGGEVATLVSMNKLEVRVDIPQQYFQALSTSPGSIELLIPAIDETLVGEIIAIIPQAHSQSRLFPARILVLDEKGILLPGMSVTAMIPTGVSEETMTVSKDAIVRTPTGEHLFFNADGIAVMMPVNRLFGVKDRVAIRSGMLKPGMEVVVDGNERMMPGQPLNIIGEPESAIPSPQETQESPSTGRLN